MFRSFSTCQPPPPRPSPKGKGCPAYVQVLRQCKRTGPLDRVYTRLVRYRVSVAFLEESSGLWLWLEDMHLSLGVFSVFFFFFSPPPAHVVTFALGQHEIDRLTSISTIGTGTGEWAMESKYLIQSTNYATPLLSIRLASTSIMWRSYFCCRLNKCFVHGFGLRTRRRRETIVWGPHVWRPCGKETRTAPPRPCVCVVTILWAHVLFASCLEISLAAPEKDYCVSALT